MTANEAILQALAAKLAGIPGATFERARLTAVERIEGDYIVLGARWQDTPVETSYESTDWQLNTEVMIVTRGSTAIAQADALRLRVHAAMMSDTTLTGLCDAILARGHTCDASDADGELALFLSLAYEIRYHTHNTSLQLETNAIATMTLDDFILTASGTLT